MKETPMSSPTRLPTCLVLPALATLLGLPGSGCTMVPRNAEAASVAEVCGSWRSSVDGLVLELRENWTFTIVPPADSGRGQVTGTWFADETTIEFKNDADAAVCPGVPGLYRWAIDADGGVAFEKITDDCPPREAHLDDGFTRVAE